MRSDFHTPIVRTLEPLSEEQTRQPAVQLPAAAVRRDGLEQTFVRAVDNGRLRRVQVSVTSQIGDQVRVSEALAAHDAVVVSEDQGLVDGSSVSSSNS